MKKSNIFNYIFIIVIIILFSIPFFWNKYGSEIMIDIIYKDYVESEEVKLVDENDSHLVLEYNSDLDSKMYIHLIYSDYVKEIVESTITPGNNIITLEKNSIDLIKIYIYVEEAINSYKWIIFET